MTRPNPLSTWRPRRPNKSNNELLLAEVLRNGGDPNIRNGHGSIFHVAAAHDNERVMDYIIDHVPTFDYALEDKNGDKVFQKLTDPQNVGIAVKLLEKLRVQKAKDGAAGGLDLSALFRRLKNKGTVLHECVQKNNTGLLKYLVSHAGTFGLDVEAVDANGDTYDSLKVGSKGPRGGTEAAEGGRKQGETGGKKAAEARGGAGAGGSGGTDAADGRSPEKTGPGKDSGGGGGGVAGDAAT